MIQLSSFSRISQRFVFSFRYCFIFPAEAVQCARQPVNTIWPDSPWPPTAWLILLRGPAAHGPAIPTPERRFSPGPGGSAASCHPSPSTDSALIVCRAPVRETRSLPCKTDSHSLRSRDTPGTWRASSLEHTAAYCSGEERLRMGAAERVPCGPPGLIPVTCPVRSCLLHPLHCKPRKDILGGLSQPVARCCHRTDSW